MNIRRMNLGDTLGLTLTGYIQMGIEEIMKHGKCILCGGEPAMGGVCVADGSDAARQAMGTPEASNPHSHRIAFFAVCEKCKHDPAMGPKVQARVLGGVKQNGNARTSSAPTPLVDGQTFNL